jgi:hypothetical protein
MHHHHHHHHHQITKLSHSINAIALSYALGAGPPSALA